MSERSNGYLIAPIGSTGSPSALISKCRCGCMFLLAALPVLPTKPTSSPLRTFLPVLAAQFEHFIYPISILLAVPLSLPFALAWMVLINEQLNIYAIFGLFMLVGIVKKNGIMQIDYTRVLRERGVPRDEAILEANQVRLRPILMTTLLLVASMIPIALGVGPGAAGRASMAKVIIGGQMLCLLLTLLVTPVSYAIFDDWGRRLLRRGPDGS